MAAQRSRALLTQDLGDQIADLTRFPQVKSLFQLGVSADTFRDFSEEQATTEAADQRPGLVSARGSFETFCPSRGVSRGPRIAGSAIAEARAKLGEQLLVSVCRNDVPDGAVRKRAVVQRFSWALRELLTGLPVPLAAAS